eukprot:4728299-Pleurochrysis_carterae.AAC.3
MRHETCEVKCATLLLPKLSPRSSSDPSPRLAPVRALSLARAHAHPLAPSQPRSCLPSSLGPCTRAISFHRSHAPALPSSALPLVQPPRHPSTCVETARRLRVCVHGARVRSACARTEHVSVSAVKQRLGCVLGPLCLSRAVPMR